MWNMTNNSYVTHGADPTDVQEYELRRGADKVVVVEFFGDWTVELNGRRMNSRYTEEAADCALAIIGAPSISTIKKSLDV